MTVSVETLIMIMGVWVCTVIKNCMVRGWEDFDSLDNNLNDLDYLSNHNNLFNDL